MGHPNQYDVESAAEKSSTVYRNRSDSESVNDGAIHADTLLVGDSWYAKAQRFGSKFGVETRGIERVPCDERSDTGMSKIGTIWLSSNMVFTPFAIGALAFPVFNLGFIETVLIIVFFNILGILPVAFFSTFGPIFGLRQVVLSRFYFGWYGVKIIAILNILGCIGWASVTVILGAQLFNAVNPKHMPGWAGVLVIAISTFLISLFGYKFVHIYERYSWIPCFIIFLIVLGEFAHSGQFSNLPMATGKEATGSILSFATSVYGSSTGWACYAADYAVYQPVDRSRVSVFLWSFGGLFVPIVFLQILGAAVATAMTNNTNYLDSYETSGVGGLLATVIVPPLGRFGEFCLIVLALSMVAGNCPNFYSISLSLQVLARWTQHVPRFIWTFLGTLVCCAISIPGYSHFEPVLENFMLIIGYWLAIYEAIALCEHFIFIRGFENYHPENYMDKSKLPPGIAAIIAFGFGIIGAVLGMAQEWFIGPIGKLCGTAYGGDVGFELAFCFTAISYCIMRVFEKRMFGR